MIMVLLCLTDQQTHQTWTPEQGRAETFGGAGAQNIKGAMKQGLNRAVHKIS